MHNKTKRAERFVIVRPSADTESVNMDGWFVSVAAARWDEHGMGRDGHVTQ